MVAVKVVSPPLPAQSLSDRIPLLRFLRQELAPFPGRAVGTLRVVVGCTVVLVLCMTLRVPEAYLAVWAVVRMAMEESSKTLLAGVVMLIALTLGLAIVLALLPIAMDQPALRFCLMATLAALGLFLRRTFVIGAFGFVIGLIGAIGMTAPDFVQTPEHAVRFILWLWPVFALGFVAAVACNLLIAPADRATLVAAERSGGGLFVPDAFTNAEYARYAIKGTLAVMICYTLQNAVNWPGIRTCVITCLIVGLGTEGATIQKGTLRIAGALVGAAMGFLAIMLLIPGMESITSLTLLVAAGTAVAAWVTLGSPRISYAGVQIAFAFFVCVIQGFAPTWHFYTIRDRLVGILLGNVVITLVFQHVWPVRASEAMWKSLSSALRAMARLATVGSSSTDQAEVLARTETLRSQATGDFATAQQWADDATFELSGAAPARLAARERLQRAAADAQCVLLTQLALAHQRPAVLTEVLDGAIAAARRFDAVVGEYLDLIADRTQGAAHRDLPELRVPLQLATDRMQAECRRVAISEVAAHIEGRLALYRELVPRLERLGSADVGN